MFRRVFGDCGSKFNHQDTEAQGIVQSVPVTYFDKSHVIPTGTQWSEGVYLDIDLVSSNATLFPASLLGV